MINTKSAIDNIKRLAFTFQGLIQFAEDLEGVDSLENYTKELETSKNKLIKDNEDLIQSSVKAKDLIVQSELEAQKIIVDAKIESDQMITEMLQNKSNMLLEVSKEVEESKSKMQATEIKFVEKYTKAEAELAKLNLKIEEESSRLVSIQEQIAKLKSL